MKRFITKIFLYALAFFILEKSTYILLHKTPDREYDKRLEDVLKGQINKQLVVIGSSKGAGNVLAGQLENETGLTSYNLSYLGANIQFKAFMLKTLLRYNKAPEKILLVIDNTKELVPEKTLIFRYDRLYPLSKYNYINDELIELDKRTVLSKLLYSARLSKCDFRFKKFNNKHKNLIDSSGSSPFLSRTNKLEEDFFKYQEEDDLVTYDISIEIPEKLETLLDIQNMCKENNIELIFAISPNFKALDNHFLQRFEKLLLPENKLFVYDTKNIIYKDKQYFKDLTHLLKNGAEIFTTEISTFINSNKDLD